MTPLKAIEPEDFPWFDYKRYTFSLGLEQDGYAWLSGHTATEYDPDERHNVVRGGMADQTRTSLTKISEILAAAGLTLADAHRIVQYLTLDGIDSYDEAVAVTEEMLDGRRPAICTVVVNRLLRPQAWIENEVFAGPPGESSQGAFSTGDLVYLSSITGTEADEMIARAGAVLERIGLGLDNVAKTVWSATRDGSPGTIDGAATTVIGAQRVRERDATMSLDVTATRSEREQVDTAVRAGRYVFLSGQTGSGGDVAAQAESALARVLEVLAAAGGRPEHLTKTIEYVTPAGIPRYREVSAVRDRLFTPPYPASTGAICDWLEGEADFLVDAMAVL